MSHEGVGAGLHLYGISAPVSVGTLINTCLGFRGRPNGEADDLLPRVMLPRRGPHLLSPEPEPMESSLFRP
jgi:hypothetical protein